MAGLPRPAWFVRRRASHNIVDPLGRPPFGNVDDPGHESREPLADIAVLGFEPRPDLVALTLDGFEIVDACRLLIEAFPHLGSQPDRDVVAAFCAAEQAVNQAEQDGADTAGPHHRQQDAQELVIHARRPRRT